MHRRIHSSVRRLFLDGHFDNVEVVLQRLHFHGPFLEACDSFQRGVCGVDGGDDGDLLPQSGSAQGSPIALVQLIAGGCDDHQLDVAVGHEVACTQEMGREWDRPACPCLEVRCVCVCMNPFVGSVSTLDLPRICASFLTSIQSQFLVVHNRNFLPHFELSYIVHMTYT